MLIFEPFHQQEPRNILYGYISISGDIMGPTIQNLKSLLRLPTGCGEQTMTSFAPDVFVYNYLKSSNQLTKEIADTAIDYMQRGEILSIYCPCYYVSSS